MGPPVRQRYNSKARQSTLGGSSHKKRRRSTNAPSNVETEYASDDAPAALDMIMPGQREAEREQRMAVMRQELVDQGEQLSSKKRKRLDAFINKKLKQESRQESLAIIASSYKTLDNSVAGPSSSTISSMASKLKSTSTLGQFPTNPLSAKERVDKREDLDVRRAMQKTAQRNGITHDESDVDDEDRDTSGAGTQEDMRWRQAKRLKMSEKNGKIVMAEPEEETDDVQQVGTKSGGVIKRPKKGRSKKDKWGNPIVVAARSDSDAESEEEKQGSPELDAISEGAKDSVPDTDMDFEKLLEMTVQEDAENSNQSRTIPIALGLGSALKKSSDGTVLGPKVVIRAPKAKTTRMSGAERRLLRKRQAMLDEANSEEEEFESEADDSMDDGSEEEEEDGEEDLSEDEDVAAGSSADELEGTYEDGSDDPIGDAPMSEEETGSDSEEGKDTQIRDAAKDKRMKFRQWALQQTGVNLAPDLLALNKPYVEGGRAGPSAPKVGPLGASYNVPSTSLLSRDEVGAGSTSVNSKGARPTMTRRASVDEARQQLPVVAEEQPIMEAILLNPVVVICGETGSGKTTQIPQMLYEAGFGYPGSDNPGMIAVTQPRRVAAVSLAVRVASELNQGSSSKLVAHQIRYSSTTSKETAIKFMTDGVLLRELSTDFLLSRYSVVVVDEAHERGVNTDVLVGVLSRVAKFREKLWREKKDNVKPLRIVIMSATLRVSDFAANTTLFAKRPPVIEISARQHPVTVHFSRRTSNDYVTEAFKKVTKIHSRLPQGGILVFMTGQGEITALCRKLERKYGQKAIKERQQARDRKQSSTDAASRAARDWETGKGGTQASTVSSVALVDSALEVEDLDIGYDEDLAGDVDDGEMEGAFDPEALDTDDESDDDSALGIDKEESEMPIHVLPLYSLLPNEQQLKVFDPPPEGHRLVVVATNVAETSLTIPNIKYVVDTGRVKERQYDASSGVQTFRVAWVSKASAAQRAGRAGRTGPGHCYRLFSSAMFENHLEDFSMPEILRMPIEGIVLQMKSMNIDAVVNFPFPTPPDRIALRKAESLLTHLGALDPATATTMVKGVERTGTVGGKITTLGRSMSNYPVTPRFAKMLVIGHQHGCMPYIVAIVAALSVGDPFLREESIGLTQGEDEGDQQDLETEIPEITYIRSVDLRDKEARKAKRKAFFQAQHRFAALGSGSSDLFRLIALVGAYDFEGSSSTFCERNFVRAKAMKEIQQLRQQILSIAMQQSPTLGVAMMGKLKPPSDTQLKVMRQILCAGFIDQVAVRADLLSKNNSGNKYETSRGIAYKAIGVSEETFIHPSSSMFGKTPPDWIVFSEVVRTSRVWLRTITKINPAWLPNLGKSLCTFSRPLEMPASSIKIKSLKTATSQPDPNTREAFVTPHYGDLGIDLPAMKVTQKKDRGRWITQL